MIYIYYIYTHTHTHIYICVCVCVCVHIILQEILQNKAQCNTFFYLLYDTVSISGCVLSNSRITDKLERI